MIDLNFKTAEERKEWFGNATNQYRMSDQHEEQSYEHNYVHVHMRNMIEENNMIRASDISKLPLLGMSVDDYVKKNKKRLSPSHIQELFFTGRDLINDSEVALFILNTHFKNFPDKALFLDRYGHTAVPSTCIIFFPFKNVPLSIVEELEYNVSQILVREQEVIRYVLKLATDDELDLKHVAFVLADYIDQNFNSSYWNVSQFIDASIKLLSTVRIKRKSIDSNWMILLKSLMNYPWLPLKYSNYLKEKFHKLPIDLENGFISENIIFNTKVKGISPYKRVPISLLESYYDEAEDKSNAAFIVLGSLFTSETEIMPKWVWDKVLKHDYKKFSNKYIFSAEPYLEGKLALEVEFLKRFGYYLPDEKEDFKQRLISFYNSQGMSLEENLPLSQVISIFEAELELTS